MKLTWLVPISLFTAVSVQAAEISSTVTFTSDYRSRGNSQTSGDPALQGSIDAAFDNGVYIGIWGSNVDFGDDAHLEVDYYIGHSGNLTDNLSYAATLYYYDYHGYENENYDYPELDLRLYYDNFTLTHIYTNDYSNLGTDAYYSAVGYSHPVAESVSLDLHAGYTYGEAFDDSEQWDYSIGVSGSKAGLDLSLSYLMTNPDGDKVDNYNDNTVVFSVSRTF